MTRTTLTVGYYDRDGNCLAIRQDQALGDDPVVPPEGATLCGVVVRETPKRPQHVEWMSVAGWTHYGRLSHLLAERERQRS